MIVRGDFFLHYHVLNPTIRSAALPYPRGALVNIYIYIYDHFVRGGIRSGVWFRLGFSMRFAELELSVK